MDLSKNRLVTTLGAGLVIGLTAFPAFAETQLEEVVVSARKREENLQSVPLAITAITETELQRRSIRDLKDVAANTPGLTFFDINNNLAVPVIRGLSQTVIAAPDRNVALFYNGVFLSNTNVSNFDLLEMERIEVVKGPVSALYGRNAFGGAINYVPRKADPNKGVESTVEATVGSDSRYGIKGSVNLPVSDTLALRLAGGYDEWDGSIKNAYGGKVGGYDATSAAWDIRWKPTEALSVGQFGFYVNDTREQTAQYDYPNNCGQVAGTGTATNPARPSFYCGALKSTEIIAIDPRAKGSSRDGVITGLNVDYDFGPVTASIIGGFANLHQQYLVDRAYSTDTRGIQYTMYNSALGPLAGAPPVGTQFLKVFQGSGPDTTRDMSWEFRLASDTKQRFRWMVGVSDYKHYLARTTKFMIDSTGYTGTAKPWSIYSFAYGAFGPVTNLASLKLLSSDHINDKDTAEYANLEFDITDTLKVSGDLRRDSERRQLTNNLTGSVQSRKDDYTTYRVSVDYKLAPTTMVYASVAKGVIAGFFNGTVDAAAGNKPVPVELQNYQPSSNITYEAGFKANWLDRRLQANMALFYIDYKDLQITAAPPAPLVTALTTNAAKATAKGLELSLDGRLSEQWTAGLGLAFTDPKYGNGAIDLSNTRYCGVPPICTTNVAGNQLTRASKQTLNAYLQYEDRLSGDWTWFARLDGRNQSKQFPRSLSLEWYDGYSLANARVGFSQGNKLDVELWVKNLTDKVYVATGITQPNSNASPVQTSGLPDFIPNSLMGDRRSFGLTARYKF